LDFFFTPPSPFPHQNLTLDIPKILLLGDGLFRKTPSTLYRNSRIYQIQNESSNNLNLKSMKKSNILLVIVMMALQGFFACKSDDISPQTPSQSLSQKAQSLIKENDLKRVEKPNNTVKIIYLKDVEHAIQFLDGLKGKLNFIPIQTNQAKVQWISPRSENGLIADGIFTFPNGHSANMTFDANGDISSLKINGNNDISHHYEPQNGYLEIIKWGIIAIPQLGDLGNGYEYYYAPVIRWEMSLDNQSSRIRYFNTEANLDVEDFGTFEVFYTPSELLEEPSPTVH
jgi:hypothetical protein